jgi:hypothetical protein
VEREIEFATDLHGLARFRSSLCGAAGEMPVSRFARHDKTLSNPGVTSGSTYQSALFPENPWRIFFFPLELLAFM